MATKLFQVMAAILFFLLALHLHPVEPRKSEDPFGFIKHLEECQKGDTVNGLHQLKHYLNQFGYLKYNVNGNNKHANGDEFDDSLELAIKTYQLHHNLDVTGTLDSATVSQMMKPRCGVPDFVTEPQIPNWDKSHLTYRFRPGIEALNINIRSICGQAFQKWAQVTDFTFEEVAESSVADIEIGLHGIESLERDDPSLDGLRGGVVAHANSPPGSFHFDVAEKWSGNPGTDELDLFSVCLHEIGHVLGLDHSEDRNAVMHDTLDYGIAKRDLSGDDLRKIRTLYELQH